MTPVARRVPLISAVLILAALGFRLLPPITQDPAYHSFADQRALHGIPNFWNVVSNIAFLLAATYGARALWSRNAFKETWERAAFCTLLAGTVGVAFGSAYYHVRPSDAALFWDRLPMTVVFLSLVASTAGERIAMKAGKLLLFPLLCLGIASVVYWRISSDLRLYVLVQFGSMAALALILGLFRRASDQVWWTLGLYGLAKVLELGDHQIALIIATGGHPLKHLVAAGALAVYCNSVINRRPAESWKRDGNVTLHPPNPYSAAIQSEPASHDEAA